MANCRELGKIAPIWRGELNHSCKNNVVALSLANSCMLLVSDSALCLCHLDPSLRQAFKCHIQPDYPKSAEHYLPGSHPASENFVM
jgi:hypothetical protein